jgi:hypothetical protein
MVDVDAWLKTLEAVARLDGQYQAFVPGHGAAIPEIRPWARANTERLREIRGWVAEGLHGGRGVEPVLQECADRSGLSLANPTSYFLAQTAILACVTSLVAAGEATMAVEGNRLRFR